IRGGNGPMLLVGHGLGTLGGVCQIAPNLPGPIGLAGSFTLAFAVFAEVPISMAIIAGVFATYPVIPLVITMLTAAIVVHGADPLSKIEFALLYAVPLITLFFTGSGDFSLDKFRTKA